MHPLSPSVQAANLGGLTVVCCCWLPGQHVWVGPKVLPARLGCLSGPEGLQCTCCQVSILCVALLQTSASLAPASSAGSPQQQQQSPTAAVGRMARIEARQAVTGDTASDWQQNPAAAASVASSVEGLPEGMQRPTLLQAQTYEQVGLLASGRPIHMGLCCQERFIPSLAAMQWGSACGLAPAACASAH